MSSPSFLTVNIEDAGDRHLLLEGLALRARVAHDRIQALSSAAVDELAQAREALSHKLEAARVRSEALGRARAEIRPRAASVFRAAYGAALRACALLESRIALHESRDAGAG